MAIFGLLCLFGAGRLCATPLSEQKVRKAVETWVRGATADRRPKAVISRVEPYQENGVTLAYVIHLADGGYCLAGADSLALPVYWYSAGTYDPQNPGCQTILKEIAGRVTYVRRETAKGGAALRAHQAALSKRARMWDDLSAGDAASSLSAEQGPAAGAVQATPAQASGAAAGPTEMVLPLTSKWDQGAPYNGACPELPPGSGKRVIVGCVATAMAQVMQYWRWPDRGVGESDEIVYRFRQTPTPVSTPLANDPGIPAHWRGDRLWWASGSLFMTGAWDESVRQSAAAITDAAGYQSALRTLWNRLEQDQTTHSVNFGATTYNWNLLQDTHTPPVDSGDNEVAKLSFHAGLAVNMDYGLLFSGASRASIAGALRLSFRYDPDVFLEERDVDRMVEEIQWYRPILLCGSNPDVGHCWVVFGYNQGTSPWQFRMNMGWGGDSDGWYSVDSVPYDLNEAQSQVVRVAPFHMVRFVGWNPSVLWPDGSPSDPNWNVHQAIIMAPDGATLIFKAGSINTFSDDSLVINRPLTLKGYNATIMRDH